jgi:hypothetical protein
MPLDFPCPRTHNRLAFPTQATETRSRRLQTRLVCHWKRNEPFAAHSCPYRRRRLGSGTRRRPVPVGRRRRRWRDARRLVRWRARRGPRARERRRLRVPKVESTGLAQNLGQIQASNRDVRSNCWVNLQILGQLCEVQASRPQGRSDQNPRARRPMQTLDKDPGSTRVRRGGTCEILSSGCRSWITAALAARRTKRIRDVLVAEDAAVAPSGAVHLAARLVVELVPWGTPRPGCARRGAGPRLSRSHRRRSPRLAPR